MGRTSPAYCLNFNAKAALVSLVMSGHLGTLTAAPNASETLVDRLVAIVDGHPILYSDIQDKIEHGPLVAVSEYPATESSSPVERAMQDAINFELILQKAKELEIEVRDDEVDTEINRFLQSRDLTHEGLLNFLKQQNKNYEDYKKDFRSQMILRRFQGRVISPLVKITDKDIETYYLKKTGSTADVVELSLRQILIKIPSDSTPEIIQAKQALAREVHQKLGSGMDFKEAVKIYSDDLTARDTGGLMEGIRLKDLSGNIRTEVDALDVGHFTAPIQTTAGFHLFYMEGRKFSGSKDFLNQKSNLEFELKNLELATQTKRWLTEQRQKSKIEPLLN